MARITISLPENLAESAAFRAAAEKRSASSYVALLIERDVQAHAPPPPALAEFVAKLQAAHAASPGILGRLESALRRELRHKKSAA